MTRIILAALFAAALVLFIAWRAEEALAQIEPPPPMFNARYEIEEIDAPEPGTCLLISAVTPEGDPILNANFQVVCNTSDDLNLVWRRRR